MVAGNFVTQCGRRTILGGKGLIKGGSGSGSGNIKVTYSLPSIPYHFSLRVKMAFYIFNTGGSTALAWVKVTSSTTNLNRTYTH